jgi:PDZ domain-containing protein
MFSHLSPLRYRWSLSARVFFYLLFIAILFAPVPFVFFKPGTPDNVTGSLISIDKAETFPVNGKLFITSILVTNPTTRVLGSETLYNWAVGPHAVLPREVVYPPALPGTVVQRQSRNDFASSKVTATAAALRYLGYEFFEAYFISDVRDYSQARGKLRIGDLIIKVDGNAITEIEEIRSSYSDKKIGDPLLITVERVKKSGERVLITESVTLVANQESTADAEARKRPAIGILVGTTARFPIDVQFNLEGVGGPSAGMIFALGIIEKLTAEDLLRGRRVAGTGTISANGSVGPIGGIEAKMVGASRRGATIFLAPRANCSEIQNIPSGLQVIPVSTLSEAISALRAPEGFKFPTC